MSSHNLKNDNQFNVSYSEYEESVPIEVLLNLCSTNKVDIRDIFISNITSEFVKYVEKMQNEEKNYDEISAFLVYAAMLIEIKSARLLPLNDSLEDDFEEVDSEELLFLKAEEYRMLQEAANELSNKEILNRFYRSPEFTDKDAVLIVKDSTIDKMVEAFKLLLEENEEFFEVKTIPKVIEKERFSVANRIEYLAKYVKDKKSFLFSKLIDDDFSKTEKITTFLAVLELVKLNIININQEERDILIKFNENNLEFEIETLFENIDSYE